MPDRTLEELRRIRKDVELFKNIWDKYEGQKVWHLPFDNKSVKDDWRELSKEILRDLKSLVKSDKLKSCEGEKMILSQIDLLESGPDYLITPAGTKLAPSHKVRPVNLSIDEIYKELLTNPLGRKINKELDKILGSGCDPVGIDEKVINEAKKVAFNPANITFSNSIRQHKEKSEISIT